MNFNINKYQAGGLVTVQPLPLANQQQQVSEPVSQQPTQTAESEKKSSLSNSMLEKLLGQGITTDVMAYKNELDKAKYEYAAMPDIVKNTAYGKSLKDIISGNDWSSINRILRNKESFQQGIDNVKANNAYDEFAVNSDGMVVQNRQTGEVTTMTAEEFANLNKGEKSLWSPITNSNLINEREMNPLLVNDTRIFSAFNNAKSITGVRKEIDSFLTNLGSTSETTTSNTFQRGKSKALLGAVQDIKKQVEDGVFDVKTIIKKSSNSDQLKAVLDEAMQSLSPSSIQLLKAKAAVKGVPPDKLDSAVQQYVALMLAGKLSSTTESTIDTQYAKDLTADIGAGAGKGVGQGTVNKGYFETLIGLNAPVGQIEINTGSNTSYKAPASIAGSYRQQGKATGPMMVSDMTDLLSLVNQEDITVGDAHVDKSKLGSIMYQGSSLANARLPITIDDKGKEVPDYKLASRIEQAQNEIKRLKFKDVNTIKSIYLSHGIATNDKGQPQYKYGQFILFDVLADENALDNKKDNSLYSKVDDDESTNLFEQRYEYGNESPTKEHKRNVASRGHLFWKNNLYQTKMALRVQDTGPNARFADDEKMVAPKAEATNQFYRENTPIWSGTTTVGQTNQNYGKGIDFLNNI